MFGINPPSEQPVFETYERDPTPQEEIIWAQELARTHAAPIARSYVASAKTVRDRTRAYLQEKKGLLRTYAKGDWVLRVRQRKDKSEPFYDGPWTITACHDNNTYSIASPGGVGMRHRYNGTHLFPAYVSEGHSVQSLWYASKTLLEQDRKRIAEAAGLV